MMDLDTIKALNDEALERAEENGDEPLQLNEHDREELKDSFGKLSSMPMLGDYIPNGWSKVDINDYKDYLEVPEWWWGCKLLSKGDLWCDSSGLGRENEPSLTMDEFRNIVNQLLDINQNFGFGLYSTGQFQAGVRVFRQINNN